MTDLNPEERMLRPREVAQWLGLHVNTVKRMSKRGDLMVYRIGERGDLRYKPSDIEAYLAERRATSAEPGRDSGDARGDDEGGVIG